MLVPSRFLMALAALLYSPTFGTLAATSATAAAYTVSVKDFGATGDGITDDARAIQAGLDSVPAAGGTVFVPAGDYRLGASLVIGHNGTTFTGEGPASILRLMDGVQQSGIILPRPYGGNLNPNLIVKNVTISRLTVDGNHNPVVDYNVPNHGPDYFGVFVRQASGVTLSELVVRNWASDGISISNGGAPIGQISIQNCLITGIRRNGIHVGFATGVTIRGNHISDTPSQWWGGSAGSGIDVEVEGCNVAGSFPPGESGTGPFPCPYVSGLLIRDNIIERTNATTAGDGIALQPAYGPISQVTIYQNLICGHQLAVQATGAQGLYGRVAGVHAITVRNNWMSVDPGFSVSGNPVSLTGCADVIIDRNIMNDVANGNFSGGGASGAANVEASKNIQIHNNRIWLNQIWPNAISKIRGGSDSVNIAGNSHRTLNNVQVMGDGTNTRVTVSGNKSLAGTPWDRTPPTTAFGIIDGTIISSPRQVTVAASDEGSGVARVYFFVDGVPQGFSDKAPYTFALDPGRYTAGPHELEARAVDGSANPSSESRVTVQMGGRARGGDVRQR